MHICTKNISYLYGRIVGRSIFHGSYYGLAFFSTENTSLRFFPMLFFDRGNFMYPRVTCVQLKTAQQDMVILLVIFVG